MCKQNDKFLYPFRGEEEVWEIESRGKTCTCRIVNGQYAGTKARFNIESVNVGIIRYKNSLTGESLKE